MTKIVFEVRRIVFAIRECHRFLDRTQELATVGFLPSKLTAAHLAWRSFSPFCHSTAAIPLPSRLLRQAHRGLPKQKDRDKVFEFKMSVVLDNARCEKSREWLTEGKLGCCRAFVECDKRWCACSCSVRGGRECWLCREALHTPAGGTGPRRISGL